MSAGSWPSSTTHPGPEAVARRRCGVRSCSACSSFRGEDADSDGPGGHMGVHVRPWEYRRTPVSSLQPPTACQGAAVTAKDRGQHSLWSVSWRVSQGARAGRPGWSPASVAGQSGGRRPRAAGRRRHRRAGRSGGWNRGPLVRSGRGAIHRAHSRPPGRPAGRRRAPRSGRRRGSGPGPGSRRAPGSRRSSRRAAGPRG